MTHSDLEKMCRGYGLHVLFKRDGKHLIYAIVPIANPFLPLGSVTTTELHEMSASELEDLVVSCSVRSMAPDVL